MYCCIQGRLCGYANMRTFGTIVILLPERCRDTHAVCPDWLMGLTPPLDNSACYDVENFPLQDPHFHHSDKLTRSDSALPVPTPPPLTIMPFVTAKRSASDDSGEDDECTHRDKRDRYNSLSELLAQHPLPPRRLRAPLSHHNPNPVSRLMELCQKNYMPTPEFDVNSTNTTIPYPAHRILFCTLPSLSNMISLMVTTQFWAQCIAGGFICTGGLARSKQRAKEIVCEMMYPYATRTCTLTNAFCAVLLARTRAHCVHPCLHASIHTCTHMI